MKAGEQVLEAEERKEMGSSLELSGRTSLVDTLLIKPSETCVKFLTYKL